MSKFKVGDKVRVLPHNSDLFGTKNQIGKIATIVFDDGTNYRQYRLDVDDKYAPWREDELQLVVEPRREFIVIRRDGAKTIAELRHDREVIKSGTAICNASDTFDFQTGAKLAFDRLMGREEPQPAHRFKVGDRVETSHGIGTIKEDREYNYYVEHDNWFGGHNGNGYTKVKTSGKNNGWFYTDHQLSTAPAPEPPKFYTGKVVCISGEYGVGRIFAVKDGFFVHDIYNCPGKPYKSVDDMNDRFLFGKFAEAKE